MRTNQAERIWGSEVQLGVAAGAQTTLTFQAAQPLWADLNRICLQAFSKTDPGATGNSAPDNDLSLSLSIQSLQIRGAYEVIRGTSANASFSGFSPFRAYNPYRLQGSNWQRFAPGETITVQFTPELGTYDANVSGGIPVVLDCDKGLSAVPANVMTTNGAAIMGSDLQANAFGANTTGQFDVTYAFNEAGTLDVSNSVLSTIDDDTNNPNGTGIDIDLISSTLIHQITMIDGNSMVVGQSAGGGDIAIPAGMFGGPGGPLDREHPWVLLPMQSGSAGSEVVFSVEQFSTAGNNGVCWTSAPYYPKGAQGPAGSC